MQTRAHTHTHRYWWIGDPGPSAVLPNEKSAAATLAARPTPFSGFVAVEQPQRQEGSQKAGQVRKKEVPGASAPGPCHPMFIRKEVLY